MGIFCAAILLCLYQHLLQQQLINLYLPPSAMSTKRPMEFTSPPKIHYVRWEGKQTRRGIVQTAEIIATQGPAQTPKRPKKPIKSKKAKFTQDQTPRSGQDNMEAISLPPIPTPDILAPKRNRRGKA